MKRGGVLRPKGTGGQGRVAEAGRAGRGCQANMKDGMGYRVALGRGAGEGLQLIMLQGGGAPGTERRAREPQACVCTALPDFRDACPGLHLPQLNHPFCLNSLVKSPYLAAIFWVMLHARTQKRENRGGTGVVGGWGWGGAGGGGARVRQASRRLPSMLPGDCPTLPHQLHPTYPRTHPPTHALSPGFGVTGGRAPGLHVPVSPHTLPAQPS